MRKLSAHAEWLRLVEVSGPFLSMAMLERAFPQGLEAIETPRRQRLRSAYEEWREAVDQNDPQLVELHREWVRLVIEDILEYDQELLVGCEDFGPAFTCDAPECAVTFVPDLVVKATGDENPRLLISIHPPDTDLEKALTNDSWPVPIVERMTLLCRTIGVRLGLVTNGERWMLVNAPVGSTSSYTSWYSRLWFQEPVTLKAFLSLLGVRRCLGPADETLDELLAESLKHHEEVTDTLGEQVRRAVEVLVQCLDKANQDRNDELLHNVSPSELYEAGLTIMMRLVFVLCAEERGLLLLDDPVYDQYYAISTLRSQLTEDADRHGPEVLDRRYDAWARLLAVFRAIYGGIEHPSLRLPALGGSLFDPDKYPFLEGRIKGSKWLRTASAPLPIDNRTVLLLLEALQLLEQPGGALLLSYQALDVENIGHVYEGLLEHTVVRVPEVTLGLIGSQKAKSPTIALRALEEARSISEPTVMELLFDFTQRSESAIRNALSKQVDDTLAGRISTVCGGDIDLVRRILPFGNLLRTDAWDDPIIYRANSFMVAIGADRRETGTHYTPKALTETIVSTTLEPIVFIGPTEGKPREEWSLKTPTELLGLKICDPAMGSGAFLVQVCRYISQKLVEAWSEQEGKGKVITTEGEVYERLDGRDPMATNIEDRLLTAKLLVSERCLYGVDVNPLAVELGKLSIWLITMAKGRPFGFLDHNVRCGDSLLGIHRLDQLTELRLEPSGERQLRLFGQSVNDALAEALELRLQLRETPIRDIHDVETMASIDSKVHSKLELPQKIADAFIGAVLVAESTRALEYSLAGLASQADSAVQGEGEARNNLILEARRNLKKDALDNRPRRPFHWPLEFPEVFVRTERGFDAIVGNPPFLGGKRITSIQGKSYRGWLLQAIADGRNGSADLVAYFFLRSYSLLSQGGNFGLLAVNTIAEGDTRQVGLEAMVDAGAAIYAAWPNEPWPGAAAVITSRVHVHKGQWLGQSYLLGNPTKHISAFLSEQEELSPERLKANASKAYIGSYILGMGFVLTSEEALKMLDHDPRNRDVIFPYINGDDLNSDPHQSPSRWVINFWDWPEDRAETYGLPYKWVIERVKPERQRRNDKGDFVLRKPLPERWWQYADKRPALYHSIGRGDQFQCHPKGWKPGKKPLEHLIGTTLTSKHRTFVLIPNQYVVDQTIVTFASDKRELQGVLQSSIHLIWAQAQGGSLESRPRYIQTDCFETFPFPSLESDAVLKAITSLNTIRSEQTVALGVGLTGLYNRFHNPGAQDPCLERLRELHREIDLAVSSAYGWDDLDLGHGFHEVPYLPKNDRVRFTISEPARIEVLRRLSHLNRERYLEEVDQVLHSGESPTRTTRGRAKSTSQSGFDFSAT